LLRAPLASSAGGLQRAANPSSTTRRTTTYQTLLARIQDASRRLHAEKRFDMPGFRPNRYYIRQMQLFGVLPNQLPPAAYITLTFALRKH